MKIPRDQNMALSTELDRQQILIRSNFVQPVIYKKKTMQNCKGGFQKSKKFFKNLFRISQKRNCLPFQVTKNSEYRNFTTTSTFFIFILLQTLSGQTPEQSLAFVAPGWRLEIGGLEVMGCRTTDRVQQRLKGFTVHVQFLNGIFSNRNILLYKIL